MDFADKTILITGAGSGMGRIEAQEAARRGAQVIVSDISEPDGLATVEHIESAGGHARFQRLDVTDFDAWQGLARNVEAKEGQLHGLVNNAGISHRFGILDTSAHDWQTVIDINLSSVFYGMKTMAPLMMQAERSSIVNISSIAGLTGYFAAGYAASKWGVRGISKTAALEFAPHGIRVNSVHPGLVDTPLLNSGTGEFVDRSLESVPAGRVAKPEEIATTVLFLLSEDSSYISGSEIVVDGGLTSSGLYHRILSDLN